MQKHYDYLTVEELAVLIRLTPGTIRNKLSKGGGTLPPCTRLSGSRRVLFLMSDVEVWLLKHKSLD